MKFLNSIRTAARALPILLLAALLPGVAIAQSVTPFPFVVKSRGNVDLGNGPLKIRMVGGQTSLYTSQGSGTGTASASTALTLTATPATPPCIGCVITCNAVSASCSIPAGTTVAAYNGSTGITLSASSTITAVQVNWGAACPTTMTNAPGQVQVQAGAGNPDTIIYTAARVCASGHLGTDGIVSVFPTSVF